MDSTQLSYCLRTRILAILYYLNIDSPDRVQDFHYYVLTIQYWKSSAKFVYS